MNSFIQKQSYTNLRIASELAVLEGGKGGGGFGSRFMRVKTVISHVKN